MDRNQLVHDTQNQKPTYNGLRLSNLSSGIIGNYIMGKSIGQGAFGQVCQAFHTLSKEPVAIKVLEKSKLHLQQDQQRVSREIRIHKQLVHKNIAQLYEVIETQTNIYLVMEYCEQGELMSYILGQERLNEAEAYRLFQQLLSAIEYSHQLNIIHRDIKLENILLDASYNAKVIDFGLSAVQEPSSFMKTPCGSPNYVAPEMLLDKQYDAMKSDIWACGVVLFNMLAGKMPFDDLITAKLYNKITTGRYKIPEFISPLAQDLIQRIFTLDPSQRIGIPEIKAHPWFSQFYQSPPAEIRKEIDEQALQLTEQAGYNRQKILKSLSKQQHNQATACYYLFLRSLQTRVSRQGPRIRGHNRMNTVIAPIKAHAVHPYHQRQLSIGVHYKANNQTETLTPLEHCPPLKDSPIQRSHKNWEEISESTASKASASRSNLSDDAHPTNVTSAARYHAQVVKKIQFVPASRRITAKSVSPGRQNLYHPKKDKWKEQTVRVSNIMSRPKGLCSLNSSMEEIRGFGNREGLARKRLESVRLSIMRKIL